MASIHELREILAKFPQKGFSGKRTVGNTAFAVKLSRPLPTLTGAAFVTAAGTEGARLDVRETAVDADGFDKLTNAYAADTGPLAAEAVRVMLALKTDAADPAPADEPAPANRVEPHLNGTTNGKKAKAAATA